MGLGRAFRRLGRNISRIADDVSSGEWWEDLGDEIEEDFRGTWERILREQQRLARQFGIDDWGDENFQKWLHQHGPYVIFAADTMGLGLGLVHAMWDDIFPQRTFFPYTGPVNEEEKVGYLIERSYETGILDILGNPDPNTDKGGGATSFFVGHLPDCVFDELTISQNGPDFESYGTYDGEDAGQIGVYAFQLRKVAGIDDGPVFVPLTGNETLIDVEAPELILRTTLKQPFKHPQRFSETYGGPVTPLAPTFVGVYATGLSPTTPGIADWYANITIRFLARAV